MSPRSRSPEQTPNRTPFKSALSWAAAAALSSTSLAVTEVAPDSAAAIEAAPQLAQNDGRKYSSYRTP